MAAAGIYNNPEILKGWMIQERLGNTIMRLMVLSIVVSDINRYGPGDLSGRR